MTSTATLTDLQRSLIPKLDDKQRDELSDTIVWITKILAQKEAAEKVIATREITHGKLLKEITELEEKANEGDRKATAELMVANDQLARLQKTLRIGRDQLEGLLEKMTQAANCARREVREAHVSVIDSLRYSIADFLTPLSQTRIHAGQEADRVFALQQVKNFTSSSHFKPMKFGTVGEVSAALESLLETLSALVAGEAVIRLNEEGGCSFPAYCGA